MAKKVVKISNLSSISSLGQSQDEVRHSYQSGQSLISDSEVEGRLFPIAKLSPASERELEDFLSENPGFRKLDRVVQLAVLAGRKLIEPEHLNLLQGKKGFINIGSSRGATSILENSMRSYLNKGQVPVLTSPASTLGNISSWLMQDLKLKGMAISTSVTCSTALQAIINSYAWLKSGLCDFAVAGGSEAPLSGFTIAQMRALRIYAESGLKYPCTPCAEKYEKGAGMVLGEGAVLFLLELQDFSELKTGDIYIESFGFASEELTSATSISSDADCIFNSMNEALRNSDGILPELIILHAPGTEQGDLAEIAAVDKIRTLTFSEDKASVLISNKWMIGHTLGASGAFNLEYGINILRHQEYLDFPYKIKFNNPSRKKINKVMINAAGFGGNATSLIVSKKI
jgi:3-oxoacyl-[acyl-carrier-protein] synthase II